VSRKLIQQLVDALSVANYHLDYCNWGDSWERECAREAKSPEQLEAALKAAKDAGFTPKEAE
jgi:hypothetical protein